jgi:Lipocalin-like domain
MEDGVVETRNHCDRRADRRAWPKPGRVHQLRPRWPFYALVVSRDRPRPANLPPSYDEKIKLFNSMLAYAGTYTVDREKAVHHVDASWNQAWTGTDQVRFYSLDGDSLTISGAPAQDPHIGQEVIHRIAFERVRNSN